MPKSPPRLSRQSTLVIALVFFAMAVPLAVLPRVLPAKAGAEVGAAASMTLRTSPLEASPGVPAGSALALVRGERITPLQAQLLQSREHAPITRHLGLLALLAGIVGLWSLAMRREPRASGMRQHLADVALTILVASTCAAALLLTPLALFAMPAGAVAILSAERNARFPALAVGGIAAVLIGGMANGGTAVMGVLALQVAVQVALISRRATLLRKLAATAFASAAALALYALLYYAQWEQLPTSAETGLATWLSTSIGPAASLLASLVIAPAYVALRGDPSSRALSRLEKLSQPLLRDLAQKAPGSWQHSLAMAKLAEVAGAAVGADTQLLRVGAYYHDIGKVAKPRYFIENVPAAERSVHESVGPRDSRDGIVGHVDQGVQLARAAGLPERIIDFIRTHHARGLLEYFWTKEQLAGGADGASGSCREDFHYTGSLPSSPETGILCICDAVEGASRHLKSPTSEELADLVHHIVYGKVRAGQLQFSGLTLGELQAIAEALSGALAEAHAPAPKASGRQEVSTAPGTARARPLTARPSIAGLSGIRLDSHDRPSSAWRHLPTASQSGRFLQDAAHAPTESISDPGTEETALAVHEHLAPSEAASSEDVETEDLLPPRAESAQEGKADGADDEASAGPTTAEREAERQAEEERATAATRGLRKQTPSSAPAQADEGLEATSSSEIGDSEIGNSEPQPKEPEVEPAAEVDLAAEEPVRERSERELASEEPATEDLATEEPASETPFLLTELKRVGPPTPPPAMRRSTIPLGKDELLIEPARDFGGQSIASKRADSQDGLRPGEMVIGAPPATHPERGDSEAKTALRPLPIPREARRPEQRITEEHLALVPPAAWGDPTAPVGTSGKGEDDE